MTTGVHIPTWTLGDRIRKARRDAGLTAEQMAATVGVSAKTLTRWENDETAPRVDDLVRISAACQVPTFWLVEADPRGAELSVRSR
jgi:transcriptional regulator with XRE-family HTH domain